MIAITLVPLICSATVFAAPRPSDTPADVLRLSSDKLTGTPNFAAEGFQELAAPELLYQGEQNYLEFPFKYSLKHSLGKNYAIILSPDKDGEERKIIEVEAEGYLAPVESEMSNVAMPGSKLVRNTQPIEEISLAKGETARDFLRSRNIEKYRKYIVKPVLSARVIAPSQIFRPKQVVVGPKDLIEQALSDMENAQQ